MARALEIVRLTVRPGEEEAFVQERPAGIAALRQFPGYVRAVLARLEDGSWLDLVVWESREQALEAAQRAPEVRELASWFAHIADVQWMEHAEIAHESALAAVT